jgi:hypothetical protein
MKVLTITWHLQWASIQATILFMKEGELTLASNYFEIEEELFVCVVWQNKR